MLHRRDLIKGFLGAGAAAGSQALWTPSVFAAKETRGHNSYFAKLNEMLKREGPGHPVMLIDATRMSNNISRITESVGRKKNYRIVY